MRITTSQLRNLIKEEIQALDEEANRTPKGNITQAAREKYATVGKDKFPIFDKKSAEAAIDLRGHAPKADRAKIINKAAKFAPEAAKKAREEDEKKNESRKITKSHLLDIIGEELSAVIKEEYNPDYDKLFMVVAQPYGDLTFWPRDDKPDFYDNENEAVQLGINQSSKPDPSAMWYSLSVTDVLARLRARGDRRLGMINNAASNHLAKKTAPESADKGTYRFIMYDKDGNEKPINVYDAPNEEHARKVASTTFAAKSHGWTFDPPAGR